jgi:hypothetical protein
VASLDGSYAKLERARFHAEAFAVLVDDVLGSQPYLITHQFEDDGWCVLRWKARFVPDLSLFPLVYGDMLTNLRAALDYVVWQLVLANGQTPTNRTAFPIVKDSAHWASAVGRNLQGVDPAWIREIERLQPFNANNGGHAERDLLAVLDEMNNRNKHRLSSVAFTMLDQLVVRINFLEREESQITQIVTPGPVEDGAEALRLRSEPPLHFEVDVDPDTALRVTFSDGMDHSDGWGYSNLELIDAVVRAVAVFEPAFPG